MGSSLFILFFSIAFLGVLKYNKQHNLILRKLTIIIHRKKQNLDKLRGERR